MKSTSKKIGKKIIFPGIAGGFALFLMSAQFANAANPIATAVGGVITSIGSAVVGNVCYAIGYIIASILGIAIAVDAWMIGIALDINASVLQSSVVQNGFSVSLSIANLAFVLGIIVIAIATILRRESYGIKQLLWKLVVMAVLVNFGLVIMSPILGLANSTTQYFLNCITPSGCSGTGSTLSTDNTFANTFAGAFNPQASWNSLSNNGSTTTAVSGSANYSGAFSIGASLVSLIIPIFGLFFLVINILLIHFVLLAFAILLLIRYLYIAILAILLPFAWASWVFPSFSSHFEAWWKKFLQWTFFTPIVMFFVYLAMQSMAAGGSNVNLVTNYAGASNSAWAPLSNFLTGAFAPVIQAFLQEFILFGLIIGGFIAASAMGIKMADVATKAATTGTANTTKWMGRTSARKVARAIRPTRNVNAAGGLGAPRPTRLDRLRGVLSGGLQKASESKIMEGSKTGFMGTMYGGIKNESGLFGKKKGGHGDGHDDGGGGGHGGGAAGGGHGAGSTTAAGGGHGAAGGGHGGAHGEASAVEQANAELDRQGFGGGSNSPAPAATATVTAAADSTSAAIPKSSNLGDLMRQQQEEEAASQKRKDSAEAQLFGGGGKTNAAPAAQSAPAPSPSAPTAPSAPTPIRPVINVNVEAPDQPEIKIEQKTAVHVNQAATPDAGSSHGGGVSVEAKKPTSSSGARIEETNHTTENNRAA